MALDSIYKQQDDGIPYRELNKDIEKQIVENRKNG